MARNKNALTSYFVGPLEDEATLELAKWISTVNDETDETTEDTAFYDGDGTPETDVMTVRKSYSFEGMFDKEDPAQAFIAGWELEVGEARKVAFKQVRTDGTTLEGPATVTAIVVTGGEASDFAPFQCTITWDRKPVVTTPGVTPQG